MARQRNIKAQELLKMINFMYNLQVHKEDMAGEKSQLTKSLNAIIYQTKMCIYTAQHNTAQHNTTIWKFVPIIIYFYLFILFFSLHFHEHDTEQPNTEQPIHLRYFIMYSSAIQRSTITQVQFFVA